MIEHVPLQRLLPYAKNARTHTPAQVAQIAASIREFGFTNPILIDEADSVIAGHGRILAADELAIEDAPCIRLTHLSEDQKRAYRIADNKIPLNAGWDLALLRDELIDLDKSDYDVKLTGFDDEELQSLLALVGTDSAPQLGDAFTYAIIVQCRDERDQAALLSQLENEGRQCRLLTT
jgi:ParB-like chromosome segregation protein Spo0J